MVVVVVVVVEKGQTRGYQCLEKDEKRPVCKERRINRDVNASEETTRALKTRCSYKHTYAPDRLSHYESMALNPSPIFDCA